MSTRLKSVYFQRPAIFTDAKNKRHGSDHLDASEHGFEILSHESTRMVTVTQDGKLIYRCPYEGVSGEIPHPEGVEDIHLHSTLPEGLDRRHPLTGLTHDQASDQTARAKAEREEREARAAEQKEIEEGKRAHLAAAPLPTASPINIADPMEDEALTATEAASAPPPAELPPEPTPRSAEAAMEDEAPVAEEEAAPPVGIAPAASNKKSKGRR